MNTKPKINLIFIEPEEIVGLVGLLGGPLGVLARHDVHHVPAAAGPGVQLRELLKSADPLHLDLVESLLRRQTDLVHSLGIVDPESGTLAPGEK